MSSLSCPPPKLGLEVRKGVVLLRPEGGLDAAGMDFLEQRIGEQLAGGARKFVLDASLLLFVDSLALGRLVRCYSQVRAAGGVLALSQVQPDLRRLLTATRLTRFFILHPSNDEAVAALQ